LARRRQRDYAGRTALKDHKGKLDNEQRKKINEVGFTADHTPHPTQQVTEPTPAEWSVYQKIAAELGKLVTEKNKAYGSAHIVSGRIMRLLFPDGIHVDRIYDALLMVRIIDKLMRLATRPTAFGESPYQDIGGYGILGVDLDSRRPGPEETKPPDIGEKV
jgi:hypothetical protein